MVAVGCGGHRLRVRRRRRVQDGHIKYWWTFSIRTKTYPGGKCIIYTTTTLYRESATMTAVGLPQYTARGTGVSRREENIIYHGVLYAYNIPCIYRYIPTYRTRGRDRLFILDRLDIHPVLIRRISAAVATYIMYIIYNKWYKYNVYSFPIDIIYTYIQYIYRHIYLCTVTRCATCLPIYYYFSWTNRCCSATGCDRLCYHVQLIRAVFVVGLLIIIQKEKSTLDTVDVSTVNYIIYI